MVYGYGSARKRHEGVARKNLAPGETRDEIHLVVLLDIALLHGVLQAVEERRAARARRYLAFIHLRELTRLNLADAGREDYRLTFLYRDVEIARNPQVFDVGDAALHVLDIFEAVIPVRLVVPLRPVVELHVKPRIARIETHRNSVGTFGTLRIELVVGLHEGVRLAESQMGPQPEHCRRMGLDEGVADQQTVFVAYEDFLFGQNDTADAIGCPRNALAVIFADIFVPLMGVDTPLIAVEIEVERRAVLNNGDIHRRKHHVARIAEFLDGDYQQAVLLARVAVNDRSTVISA